MRSLSQLNIISSEYGFTSDSWVQLNALGYEICVGNSNFVIIFVNAKNNSYVPIHKINMYLNQEGFTNGDTKTLMTGEPTI